LRAPACASALTSTGQCCDETRNARRLPCP
jgi:hypothetical protein